MSDFLKFLLEALPLLEILFKSAGSKEEAIKLLKEKTKHDREIVDQKLKEKYSKNS